MTRTYRKTVDGSVVLEVQEGRPFTLDSVKYPRNWITLSTPDQRAALGLELYDPAPEVDTRTNAEKNEEAANELPLAPTKFDNFLDSLLGFTGAPTDPDPRDHVLSIVQAAETGGAVPPGTHRLATSQFRGAEFLWRDPDLDEGYLQGLAMGLFAKSLGEVRMAWITAAGQTPFPE